MKTEINLTDNEAFWLNVVMQEWRRKEMKDVFRLVDTEINTLVDIGSNMGASVDFFWRSFTPKKIYAFEPMQRQMSISQWFLRGIPEDVIEYEPFGVYYGMDFAKVSHPDDGNNGGDVLSIVGKDLMDHDEWEEYSFKVALVELESILTEQPDLIKIDVEGAEYNIIENSAMVKNAPWLFVEFHAHDKHNTEEFVAEHLPNHRIVYTDSRSSCLLKLKRLDTSEI